MSTEDRDRALEKILINEGFSRKHVTDLIATGDNNRLEELLASLMANTSHRQRDVEITPSDQMRDGMVDFNEAKIQARQRSFEKELDEEHAHWESVRDQLIAVMAASGLDDYSLASATLGALLETFDDIASLEEAKTKVTMVLNVFH